MFERLFEIFLVRFAGNKMNCFLFLNNPHMKIEQLICQQKKTEQIG